tara:strand:+ start:170 stop:619 length:450 start_codon:yes stop_codon:yes gene_type:complete
MKLSIKVIYAIESVLDIAFNAGENPVQNIDIAKRQGIPKRYLEHTLQSLVKSKILIGSRGPKGGYRLARERRKIKLSDIVASVDDKRKKVEMIKGSESDISNKIVNPLLDEIYRIWFDHLKKITVEDICFKAEKSGLVKQNNEKIDFVI